MNDVTWTKNDCARVIVKALMRLDEFPVANHPEVLQLVKTHKKPRLEELRDEAVEILAALEYSNHSSEVV
jgi:hypothetical protein